MRLLPAEQASLTVFTNSGGENRLPNHKNCTPVPVMGTDFVVAEPGTALGSRVTSCTEQPAPLRFVTSRAT